MAKKIVMPKLGLTMKEGKLAKWYINEGEHVNKGDKLFSIETDKITNDAEATDTGILRKILIGAGKVVPIMEPVCIIAAENEDISDLLTNIPTEEEKVESQRVLEKESIKTDGKRDGKVKISPVARKLADEEGIDYQSIMGSGPGGRIVLEDIQKALEEKSKVKASPTAVKMAAELDVNLADIKTDRRIMKNDVIRAKKELYYEGISQSEDKRIAMTTMRKIIAERMSYSSNIAPTVNFTISVDMTKLKELREEMKIDKNITYTDLIVKITSLLLLEHPLLNSSLDGEEIILRNYVNMGIAVALEDGLMVPVVKNAHIKTLGEISYEIKDLSYRTKVNQLTTDEITEGTFTITNLGMLGIESFTPIINQPESAILGVNAIIDTPVVENGTILVKPIMKLSLTADHRTVDGAVAAIFLQKLKEALENPLRKLL